MLTGLLNLLVLNKPVPVNRVAPVDVIEGFYSFFYNLRSCLLSFFIKPYLGFYQKIGFYYAIGFYLLINLVSPKVVGDLNS